MACLLVEERVVAVLLASAKQAVVFLVSVEQEVETGERKAYLRVYSTRILVSVPLILVKSQIEIIKRWIHVASSAIFWTP